MDKAGRISFRVTDDEREEFERRRAIVREATGSGTDASVIRYALNKAFSTDKPQPRKAKAAR